MDRIWVSSPGIELLGDEAAAEARPPRATSTGRPARPASRSRRPSSCPRSARPGSRRCSPPSRSAGRRRSTGTGRHPGSRRVREVLHDRPRHRDAELGADLREHRLVRDPVEQLLGQERHDVVRLEPLAVPTTTRTSQSEFASSTRRLPGCSAASATSRSTMASGVAPGPSSTLSMIRDRATGPSAAPLTTIDRTPYASWKDARESVDADVGAEDDRLELGARRRRRRPGRRPAETRPRGRSRLRHWVVSVRSPVHSVWKVPGWSMRW